MSEQQSTYVTKDEFGEYSKRMDAENDRQNARLKILEESQENITEITISLTKLTSSVEAMVEEQKRQGERLSKIEELPSENWNTVRTAIITGICTAVGTGIVAAVISYMG